MTKAQPSDPLQQMRSRAVKTALLLGLVAVAIFVTFIGLAMLGR